VNKLINHLEFGNKNAEELFAQLLVFEKFHSRQESVLSKDACWTDNNRRHQYKNSIIGFVLCSGQNDAIAVDSHVVKYATALQWVPNWCKTANTVQLCLQVWVPNNCWPYVNMIFAFFGQLLSNRKNLLLSKKLLQETWYYPQTFLLWYNYLFNNINRSDSCSVIKMLDEKYCTLTNLNGASPCILLVYIIVTWQCFYPFLQMLQFCQCFSLSIGFSLLKCIYFMV